MKKFLFIVSIIFLSSCNRNLSYFIGGGGVYEGDSDYYTNEVINQYTEDSGAKLRVALLVPLTGKVSLVGQSILNTVEMSMYDNNKKNILLKVYDTKGTTFGAVEAMNKAVKDGIDVVLGPLFSEETKAIKNILKNNNIIAFSLSNDEQLKNIDNVFVTGSIPEQEIQTLISYMMENDFFNYVALMPNSSHGASMNKVLRNTIYNKDGLLIKTDYYEPNEENMLLKINDLVNFYEVPQTIFEDFEKKKLENKLLGLEEPELIIQEEEKIYPQALFIPDGGKRAEEIANLLFINQKNDRYIQLIGTSKLDGDVSIQNNPYLDKVIFVGSNPAKYQKFYDDYTKVFKREPIKISSMAYDLINVIDKFFEKYEDGYIINKKNLLDPNGFDGIDGKFRFLPNGLVDRNLYVVQLQNKEKVVVSTNQEFLNY